MGREEGRGASKGGEGRRGEGEGGGRGDGGSVEREGRERRMPGREGKR